MNSTTASLCLSVLLLPLSASGGLVNSGDALIPGTWLLDFESGQVTPPAPAADIFWRQQSQTQRSIEIYWTNENGGLYALGAVEFESVTEADLMTLSYARDPIPGGDAEDLLRVGDVFAVLTQEGAFAKAMVTARGPGSAIQLQYELYDGQTNPDPCADFDGDGSVNFNDLNALLDKWSMDVEPGASGDADGNGVVDFTDLNLLLEAWGDAC